MADDRDLDPNESTTSPGPPPEPAEPPLEAFRRALERYDAGRLVAIHQALGLVDPSGRSRALAGAIVDRLGESRVVERLIGEAGHGPRLALGLFAATESATWSLNGLAHALACLGVDAPATVRRLLDLGLLAIESGDGPVVNDVAGLIASGEAAGVRLLAHPGPLGASRTVLPEGALPRASGTIRHVRETDGLEAIVRMAAAWQRVDEAPLRRTQQGTLFKRDRDRLEDDPVLAGPIADALEPLPDMVPLWLALARGIGLLRDEPESDRVVAAGHDFWTEHAFHLPQMVATRWLALRSWHEQGGMQQEGSTAELALPHVRPAALLWLATLGEGEWVALEDFDAHLRGLAGDWDRASFLGGPPAAAPPRPKAARGGKKEGRKAEAEADGGVLASLLLGAAYQLGLVRAAEEAPGERRVVQLSPLGRYILALGPPPPPRPAFEHFLYVQPNFEAIAYRQGLTPALIGQFSRFARWSQVGAALELKLTPESVYRGLEGGLAPQEMLDRLARHSQRALPAGVAEALRTWAGRRERVTYHAAATLVEFASRADLEQALAHWPTTGRVPPVPISDRLLLVEDDAAIPFHRFRLAGSRDYRRAPEACLEVEPDGVTLSLDLGRSDLLVDAELARFADEQPLEPSRGAPGNPRRRFVVSSASLARGLDNGLTPGLLSHWYARRTGADVPPAVRLLLQAGQGRLPPLATSRPLVLHTPSAELLDGLLQHPDTRDLVGERLGPTSAVVPDESLEPFRAALSRLGLALSDPASLPSQGPGHTVARRRPGR